MHFSDRTIRWNTPRTPPCAPKSLRLHSLKKGGSMPVLHTITLLLLLSLGACQSTDELSTTGQPPGPGPFPTTGTPVFGSPGGEPTPSVDPSPDLTVLAVSSDPVVQAPPDLGTSCPSGGEASLTFSPPNPRVGERVTVTVAAPEALTNLVVTFPPSSADPL